MNWLIAILFTVAINWATMKRYTVVRAILLIFVWLWVSFLTLFVFFYLMFELFPPDPYIGTPWSGGSAAASVSVSTGILVYYLIRKVKKYVR